MSDLAQLPEAEKRRRLLALLQEDISCEPCERMDKAWKMPTLTENGRTVEAGPSFDFKWRVSEMTMPAGAWLELKKACRIAFAFDGSSWWPCGARPRCLAECVAQAVFQCHTQGASFNPKRSGAEWWAQVRHGGHAEETIQFHWDTDEAAVEQHGVHLHPHLSTVTYLSDCGAPTLVLDRRNASLLKDVGSIYGPICLRVGVQPLPRLCDHAPLNRALAHAPRGGRN